jgi:hypothetical protein
MAKMVGNSLLVTVVYDKTFLTGTLKGITVPCTISNFDLKNALKLKESIRTEQGKKVKYHNHRIVEK